MKTEAAPANAISHQIETWSSLRAGSCVRRASRIVETIAIAMNGTITSGCRDPTHSMSRSAKNSAVYGGGRAASARLAGFPQMPTTHIARPTIMPKPTDISIGPSDLSAAPSEKRLVRKWNPNTAISTAPKITHVVGCVNAAAMPIRNSAVRAPHEVRDSWTNGIIRASRKRTVMLSRYPT